MKRASNHWEKSITTEVGGMFVVCIACWMGVQNVAWMTLGDSEADIRVDSEDTE